MLMMYIKFPHGTSLVLSFVPSCFKRGGGGGEGRGKQFSSVLYMLVTLINLFSGSNMSPATCMLLFHVTTIK